MNQANPDKEYIISRIRDKRDLLEYCESIDIKIGDKIKLIAYDNFDNTVIVKTKNKEIRISPKASKDIYLLDEK